MTPAHGATWRRVVRETLGSRVLILACFVLSMVATPVALLTPLPLKILIDSVLGTHPLPGFVQALLPAGTSRSGTAAVFVVAAMFVVIELVSQLRTLGSYLLETYTGEKMVLALRNRLFRHAQRLSLAYHESRGTSDATYRIEWDAMAIQYLAVNGLAAFATSVVTVVGMVAVTAALDPWLALVALGVTPPLLAISHLYRGRLKRQAREVKERETIALGVVQEVLGALRVVKAFGQEEREQQRFVAQSRHGMSARVRLAALESAYGMVVGLTLAFGVGIVVFIGVRHVQSGRITLGELVLIMGYLAQLYEPLRTISRKAGSFQSYLTSLDRVFSVLDTAPDVPERPNARPLKRAVGRVTFEGVCYEYLTGQRVLSEVSFDVQAGSRVGLAGRSGAGKTTLLNLITRFYDPTAGRIRLDGIDLRDYRVADLREQFAIVLQEPLLFSATIAENVGYARPGASLSEIEAAAAAANAHEFISVFPEGYDTQVTERGMRLSGGERQRIALARAFLRDAPILLLDEPTSSVDIYTEDTIIEAMNRLMVGRTTFLVAHRLRTLEHRDRRLELAGGHVTEPCPPVSSRSRQVQALLLPGRPA